MKSSQRTLAIWIFLLVLVVFFAQDYAMRTKDVVKEFSYPKFIAALEADKIQKDSVTFYTMDMEIGGKIKEEFREEFGGIDFKFAGDTGDEGAKELKSRGIVPIYNNEDSQALLGVIFGLAPIFIIVVLFIFFMKQLQAGGGKAMSFGKSKAKLLSENKKKVTFKDVAGVEEAKEELSEIVHFLKDPRKYTKLGGRIPAGVLLVGPPGTGKTLLARAVAGEAGVPFFTISGSDFVEMFVGVGASRVRDMFEQGKRNAPCIIFIDEIDAVGRHRGAGMGGGHDEREQTLNQLLVEMDGFEGNEGVIVIAATNRADVLDPALLRPGRFDRRVMVGNPDINGRKAILEVHAKKSPLSKEVDLEKIARGTPGFSGADLENLINEAALFAARQDKSVIDNDDLEKAKDKILMGAERKSMIVSDHEKKLTAYHEAGHTLVGRSLPGLDPVHKVSIMPRGRALGVTMTLPEKDQLSITRSQATNQIAFLFGGRAAEEIIYKDFTSGAGNDIEQATSLARRMVTQWGMSDKIGPLLYGKSNGPVFQGMQSGQSSQGYSEEKAREIDAEVERLIKEGRETAIKILNEKSEALERLTEALLEFETIDGKEVDMLIAGSSLDEIKNDRDSRKTNLESENEKKKALDEAEKKKKLAAKNDEDGTEAGGMDPIGNPGEAPA